MDKNNRHLGFISIRIIENKFNDVVCGNARAIGLCEAVVSDHNLTVVIEAVDVSAAFADVDNRSSPLAVLAIVKEVTLDKHVARTASSVNARAWPTNPNGESKSFIFASEREFLFIISQPNCFFKYVSQNRLDIIFYI